VRIRCELSKLGSPESGSPAQNITRDPYLTFRQLVRAPRGIECDPGESTEGSVKNLSRTTRPEHKDLLVLVFSHWKSAIRRSTASPRARSSRSRNRVKHISGTILDRKHPERTESVEQVLDLNGSGRGGRTLTGLRPKVFEFSLGQAPTVTIGHVWSIFSNLDASTS